MGGEWELNCYSRGGHARLEENHVLVVGITPQCSDKAQSCIIQARTEIEKDLFEWALTCRNCKCSHCYCMSRFRSNKEGDVQGFSRSSKGDFERTR